MRALVRRSSKSAFTLLELIVVIVILGILAALAVPTFAKVIDKSKDEASVASLTSFAREAQALRAFNQYDQWTVEDLNKAAADLSLAAGGTWATSGTTLITGTLPGHGEIAYSINLTDDVLGLAILSESSNICMVAAAPNQILGHTCLESSASTSDPAGWAASNPGDLQASGTGTSGQEPATINAPSALTTNVSERTDGLWDISSNWDAVDGSIYYEAQYQLDGGDWQDMNVTDLNASTSVPGGSQLMVRVRTVGDKATSDYITDGPYDILPATPQAALSAEGAAATLTWLEVPGATSYIVSYQLGADAAVTEETTELSYTLTLTPGNGVTMMVAAVAPTGQSPFSSAQNTGLAAGIPVVSSILSGTDAVASWSAVSGASSYSVAYRLDGESADTVLETSDTSLSVALAAGRNITFKVASFSAYGSSDYSASSTVNRAASAPGGVSAFMSGANAKLTWSAVSNASGYKVTYSINGGASQTAETSATSVDVPLSVGQSISFSVLAHSAGGDSASSSASTNYPPAAPGSVSNTGMRGYNASFSWSAVTGATSYTITLGAQSVTTTGTSATLAMPMDTTLQPSVVAKAGNLTSAARAGSSVHSPSSMLRWDRAISNGTTTGASDANTTYGSALVSSNGRYTALMRADGKFVVYDLSNNTTLAYVNLTGTSRVVMQGDGNLVYYTGSTWRRQTQTSGNNNYLVMQNDGNLVIYNGNTGAAVFALSWGTSQANSYASSFFDVW